MLLRLLAHARAPVELAEAEVAVGDEGAQLNIKGRDAYYLGPTGRTRDERFKQHKAGYKASRWVKRYSVRLVPELYEHLNPMFYRDALETERKLSAELKQRGWDAPVSIDSPQLRDDPSVDRLELEGFSVAIESVAP